MNVKIKLNSSGKDTGPFNIYSDVDGYISAFDNNVTKQALDDGFYTANVPEGTTQIKIQSINENCNNFIILEI